MVDSTTFEANQAIAGGALFHQRSLGSTTIVNSTFWNDYAATGAVIHDAGAGTVQVFNSTLQSPSAVPASLIHTSSGSSIKVHNSILSSFWNMRGCNQSISGNGNMVQIVNPAAPAEVFDPSCGLSGRFGEILTGFLDPAAGVPLLARDSISIAVGHLGTSGPAAVWLPYYPLPGGCSAIDAGVDGCPDPVTVGSSLAHDQLGQPRPVGASCDIGAFEVQ